MKLYVQGDVYLIGIKELPKGLSIKKNDNRGIVLAEGEHTGHAHIINDDAIFAILLEGANKEMYLQALKEVEIKHQEHKSIVLPAGNYKVGIIREYDYFLEESRKVVD